MSFRKFKPGDVSVNTMKAHPEVSFFIYNGRCFVNGRPHLSGAQFPASVASHYAGNDGTEDIYGVTPLKSSRTGSYWLSSVGSLYHTGAVLSMYEYNINRTREKYVAPGTAPMAGTGISGEGEHPDGLSPAYFDPRSTAATLDPARAPLYGDGQYVMFPYLTKDSARESFKRAGMLAIADGPDPHYYDTEFQYGDILTGSYPLSASISREWLYRPGLKNSKAYWGLKPLFEYYKGLSPHYAASNELFNKADQLVGLTHIPKIFYGNRIKPGSVSLKMYYTGALCAELRDLKQNGELIQVSGTSAGANDDGKVAGVIFYNEGFIWLTGSWALNNKHVRQQGTGDSYRGFPRWRYWNAGNGDGLLPTDSTANAKSFANVSSELTFRGETETQVLTMYARAPKDKVNYSNNPTYIKYGQEKMKLTSSHVYEENSTRLIKNTVSSSYTDPEYSASFKRQVYISKIGIYDENKNLIGIASLANPVLKEEDKDLTFKLRLDI